MNNSGTNYKIIGAIVVIIIVAVAVYAYTRSAHAPTGTPTATSTATTGTPSTDSGTTPTATKGGTHPTAAQMVTNDAAVRAEMASILASAATYYNAHTKSYGTEVHNSCANATAGTTVFSSPAVRSALVTIIALGGAQQVCEVYAGGSSFAVSVQTTSNPAQWYCIDSTGFKGNTTGNTLAITDAGCQK